MSKDQETVCHFEVDMLAVPFESDYAIPMSLWLTTADYPEFQDEEDVYRAVAAQDYLRMPDGSLCYDFDVVAVVRATGGQSCAQS